MEQPALVSIGDRVVIGQQLGFEGNTGNTTGYHVHIEIRDSNGNRVNPATFMGIPNVVGQDRYIYDGNPIDPPEPIPENRIGKKFKWVLYANKLRNKRQ